MNFVEGFTAEGVEPVYTRQEALAYFKEQSEITHLPFIFLSAGVSVIIIPRNITFSLKKQVLNSMEYYVDVLLGKIQ